MKRMFILLVLLCTFDINTVSIAIPTKSLHTCIKSINAALPHTTQTSYNIFTLFELSHIDSKTTFNRFDLFVWAGDVSSKYTRKLPIALDNTTNKYEELIDYLDEVADLDVKLKTHKFSYQYSLSDRTLNGDAFVIPFELPSNFDGLFNNEETANIFTWIVLDERKESLVLRLTFEKNSGNFKSVEWGGKYDIVDRTKELKGQEYMECFRIDNKDNFTKLHGKLRFRVENNVPEIQKDKKATFIEKNKLKLQLLNFGQLLHESEQTEVTEEALLFYTDKQYYGNKQFKLTNEERAIEIVKFNRWKRRKNIKRNVKYVGMVAGFICGTIFIVVAKLFYGPAGNLLSNDSGNNTANIGNRTGQGKIMM